jgi:hypothetical protein
LEFYFPPPQLISAQAGIRRGRMAPSDENHSALFVFPRDCRAGFLS